jgi:hypothetical protein
MQGAREIDLAFIPLVMWCKEIHRHGWPTGKK